MDWPIAVGDVLDGKYRVERILGAGGMGVVFLARHLTLGEPVALKLLLADRALRADATNRFLREGRAAARIRSELVARVFDTGQLPSGEAYLVMEHVPGSDLRAVLREGRTFSLAEGVDLLLQIAEALAVVHAAAIVHRDLKPSNVILTRGADGLPAIKLIDFGISKDLQASDGAEATRTTQVMGSPSYMAPEQMRSARHADNRSDIWAFGALAWTLFTGEPPFAGETVAEIYDCILTSSPSLLSARPDLPSSLEAVLSRCLARAPEDRFCDVAELASALTPFAETRHAARADRIGLILRARAAPPSERADPSTSGQETDTSDTSHTSLAPTEKVVSSDDSDAPSMGATSGRATLGDTAAPRERSWGAAPASADSDLASRAGTDRLVAGSTSKQAPSPPRWVWGAGLGAALLFAAILSLAWLQRDPSPSPDAALSEIRSARAPIASSPARAAADLPRSEGSAPSATSAGLVPEEAPSPVRSAPEPQASAWAPAAGPIRGPGAPRKSPVSAPAAPAPGSENDPLADPD